MHKMKEREREKKLFFSSLHFTSPTHNLQEWESDTIALANPLSLMGTCTLQTLSLYWSPSLSTMLNQIKVSYTIWNLITITKTHRLMVASHAWLLRIHSLFLPKTKWDVFFFHRHYFHYYVFFLFNGRANV